MRAPYLQALLLAAVTLGALYAGAQGDPTAIPKEQRFTECWPCHNTWDPPLREMYHILPPDQVTVGAGEIVDYAVRVQNGWIADLVRFEPQLDLRDAPSLAFANDGEPSLGETYPGMTPFTPTTTTQRGVVSLSIEAGVTDLRIRLLPNNQDPTTGPDFAMRIFPGQGGQDQPRGRPALEVDEAGRGATETLHLPTSQAIQELGEAFAFSEWLIEAVYPVSGTPPSVPSPGGTGFTVVADKYFNASADRQSFLSREEVVGPDATTVFQWPLRLLAAPGEGEIVRVTVNLTGHYDHPGPEQDYENFTKTVEVPVGAGPEGGALLGLDDAGTIAVPDAVRRGVSMDRVSEVIGYVTTFLLVASVWTGGMFGKTSRRQLNSFFGSAKRRVAFHNILSYAILAAGIVHTVLFIIETKFPWTVGLIWGGIALLALIGLGVTGAIQVPMIRRWNYATWRWTHLGLSIAVLVFTVVHIFLDGQNWGEVRNFVPWDDPFHPQF